MSGPSEPDRKLPEQTTSIEERVDQLFEELSFAIQWHRPSILLVFYKSENVHELTEFALQKRLTEIGQQVTKFSVDKDNYDIPLLLSQRPERDHSVYSVSALSRGGGKSGANAYRALNIRREYFVDFAIRVIIWLDGDESIELSRHAPDFWAFRHRVVEFYDAPDAIPGALSNSKQSGSDQEFGNELESLHTQIRQNEALIAGLSKQLESSAMRLNLLVKLALLYQADGAYDQAIQGLKQGLVIAKRLNNPELLARLWGNYGSVRLDLNQPNSAVRAYKKAIRYSPEDAGQWVGLGHVYRKFQRLSDAIIAYKQAYRLDPHNPAANSSIVACYRLLGKDTLAEQQKVLALSSMENETEYNRAVFESACGNTRQAIEHLACALEEKQASLNGVRHDPNFDFIRDATEYQQLLGKTFG